MAKQITIIDAIKNRWLFGALPRFKALDSWAAWLVVLKAIFGLSMTAVAAEKVSSPHLSASSSLVSFLSSSISPPANAAWF